MSDLLLFAYGTLRKGCSRHVVLDGYPCVSLEAILKGFAMYDLGPFPAILQEKKGQVKGEIYRVDRKCVELLDHIEGYREEKPETSFYRRTEVEVQDRDGKKHPCFTYTFAGDPVKLHGDMRPNGVRRLDSGDWMDSTLHQLLNGFKR